MILESDILFSMLAVKKYLGAFLCLMTMVSVASCKIMICNCCKLHPKTDDVLLVAILLVMIKDGKQDGSHNDEDATGDCTQNSTDWILYVWLQIHQLVVPPVFLLDFHTVLCICHILPV